MRKLCGLFALLALASCVAPRSPAPVPPPPRPALPPAQAPLVQAGEDWRDVPLTPGTWTYRPGPSGGSAAFGTAGAAPVFVLRCDLARRLVVLERTGTAAPGAAMTVTTSAGIGRWPLTGASVALRASDPFLDKLAFSRGRVLVEVPGLARLVLPAWAEPARAIEDCRG